MTRRDVLVGVALVALLACGVVNYLTARQTADTLREDTAVVFGRLGAIEDKLMDQDSVKTVSWLALYMGAKVTAKVATPKKDLSEEAWCELHDQHVASMMKTYVPCETAPK